MSILYLVLAVLLAGVCAAAAAADLTRQPQVLATVQRLGVAHLLPLLATVKALAAAGLLVGIAVRPLGAVTAAAMTLYFALAVAFHLRANDTLGESAPPAVFSLLSAGCLVAAVGS